MENKLERILQNQVFVDNLKKNIGDSKSNRSKEEKELTGEKLECKRVESELDDAAQKRTLRYKYSRRVFNFMCIWSVTLLFILLFNGFWCNILNLSDTVLATLCGGTSATVIGLVGFVVKGLFNSSEK